jgi:hypothetical protein
MTKLIPQLALARYVGSYSKPAFALYGATENLWSSIFSIFTPFQIPLEAMRNASTSLNPADQIITVEFGQGGEFRFKFDQIEVATRSLQDFKSMPELLNHAAEWLRSAVPGFSFQTHMFIFASQNLLSGTTAKEFLLGLTNVDISGIGTSKGSGIIFHWDIPEHHWDAQLMVDHSASVSDGLFIQLIIRSDINEIDFITAMSDGEELLSNALTSIGLQGPEES